MADAGAGRRRARRRARVVAFVETFPEGSTAGDRHLSLEVRGRRFGWLLDDHHGDGRLALHCRAEPGAAQRLIASAPDRFHLPAYVAHRHWVGLWLDLPAVDWPEMHALLADAYAITAPRRLLEGVADGGGPCVRCARRGDVPVRERSRRRPRRLREGYHPGFLHQSGTRST